MDSLPRPSPPIGLGDGEAEHAELGHLGDHLERNVGVCAVPLLGARHHLAVGELAHLVAHGVEEVVETAVADRGVGVIGHQCDQAGAILRGVAGGDELFDPGGEAHGDRLRAQPEISRTDDLALAHQDAARHLRQELAGADPHQELFDLPEAAELAHPLHVARELANRFGIGRKPGEPVGRPLLALDRLSVEAAVRRDPFAHLVGGIGEQSVGRSAGLLHQPQQIRSGFQNRCRLRHRLLRPSDHAIMRSRPGARTSPMLQRSIVPFECTAPAFRRRATYIIFPRRDPRVITLPVVVGKEAVCEPLPFGTASPSMRFTRSPGMTAGRSRATSHCRP